MPSNDDGAIVLTDTRTHRRSGSVTLPGDDHERQFLVGDADDSDPEEPQSKAQDQQSGGSLALEEDVRSFSSNASIDSSSPSSSLDSDNGRPKPHRRSPSVGAGADEDGLGLLHNAAARTSHLDVHSLSTSDSSTLHPEDEHGGKAGGGLAAKAGIIIGIHNIFIVIPQFIMTGIASIIFAFTDPSKGTDSSSSAAADLSQAGNATAAAAAEVADRGEALVTGSGPNSYAIIYR